MAPMDPNHADCGYPSFFVNTFLPPLLPNESLSPFSISNFNMPIDDVECCVSALSPPVENQISFFGRNDLSLPPHRGHHRSNSDVPLGFSDMILSPPELLPIGLKSREMDTNSCGKRKELPMFKDDTSGSNSESETMPMEGIKRNSAGNVTPPFQHSRSLSMDSMIANFHSSLSPVSLELNKFELKKIMADEKLAEIAKSDLKLAKRILANRQSAARSKERKVRYIFELEHKVQTLQSEATTLSSQITLLQKDHLDVTNLNIELRMRIQAMEQQAKLRDDLHETLMAEVERLKLVDLGMRDSEKYTHITRQQRLSTAAPTSA